MKTAITEPKQESASKAYPTNYFQQQQGANGSLLFRNIRTGDSPYLKKQLNITSKKAMPIGKEKADEPSRDKQSLPISLKSYKNHSAEIGSNKVVQRMKPWDYLKGNLTEDEKDATYFRRSRWNPMNYFSQKQNVNYEQANTAYHSTSVHGAQNSLANIRERHNPGNPPLIKRISNMDNLLTGMKDIAQQPNSSRFASSSWERHARNEAKNKFESTARNTAGGFNVSWLSTPPAFGSPAVGISKSAFHISYGNSILGEYEVGISSRKTNAAPQPSPSQTTNIVKVVINYFQKSPNDIDAWIGQMFPIPPGTHPRPTIPGATNPGIINVANFPGTAWSLSDFNPFGE